MKKNTFTTAMKWLSFTANQPMKLIIASVFFMLAINVQANPLVINPPEFFISELMFDSSGEWVIKLESIFFGEPEYVDSVCISTSSGSAKWKNPMLYPDKQQVFTLRNDSLDSDLVIRQEGDFVKVTTYYKKSWWNVDVVTYSLIFGDYPEATVRSPKTGESVVHVPCYTWVLVDSHQVGLHPVEISGYSKLYAIATISESDKRSVCTGKVRATIHNSTTQAFTESKIQFRDERYYTFFDMTQQEDDVYEGNVYACYYNLNKLHPPKPEPDTEPWLIELWGGPQRHDYWTIDPIQFEMEQDSIVLLDIYIKEHVSVDIQTVNTEENHVLKIYPNPIVENSFYYETALPIKSTNSVIEITGLTGQKIVHYPISESKGNIKLPSNILRGTYTVSLIVNQKNYVSTKIIVP